MPLVQGLPSIPFSLSQSSSCSFMSTLLLYKKKSKQFVYVIATRRPRARHFSVKPMCARRNLHFVLPTHLLIEEVAQELTGAVSDNSMNDPIVDTETVKYRLRSFGKFRLVVVVCTLLFIACVVLAVLLGLAMNKKSASAPTPQPTICDTEECLYIAQGTYCTLKCITD